jgi:hypothetical protein
VTKEQHLLAIELLEKFGLENLRLELDLSGHFRYHGWRIPLSVNNGSPPLERRGRIAMKTFRSNKNLKRPSPE